MGHGTGERQGHGRSIRAERTRLVPIIFVTAGDRSDERTFKGYEAGAVDFLYKPLNSHTLKSKVSVFIELHRKTRELERTNRRLARGLTIMGGLMAVMAALLGLLMYRL